MLFSNHQVSKELSMDTISRIIHELTGKFYDQITLVDREQVKSLNFASVYGKSTVCLCVMTVPHDENPATCILCRRPFRKEARHAAC